MKLPKIKQGRNKFNARKTLVDGILFHSAAEAARYKTLKILEISGHIRKLKLQVPLVFTIKEQVIFTYYADFTYLTEADEFIIEDVKGMRTPVYKLKKKLIEARFGIKINEVK